jgi:tetratricopeptide (TPR) repeat protein
MAFDTSPPSPEFFISYTGTDRRWAEWISWQLEEAKYPTVLQAWDFRPGANFVLEMQAAATKARRTLAVLSPDYLESSRFTPSEWAVAFADDPDGRQLKLVPVMVRKCDPPGLLKTIVYIDLIGLDEEEAKKRLLEGIRGARGKPDSAPEFPGRATRSVKSKPRFPGEWPVVSTIPYPRNPNFVGRETVLRELRSAFETGETKQRVQALHGLGGIGKTQLAAEYSFLYVKEYYVVGWLRGENSVTLGTDYVALGSTLEVPELISDPGSGAERTNPRIEAVRRWLERNDDWLLVFDDVDALETIWDYLPRRFNGHILVTSRNPNWLGVGTPRQVDTLEPLAARDFLLKRTGQASSSQAASSLAKDLGYLPLALEQAGAYIEETSISLSSYSELFHTQRSEVLKRGKPSTHYPATVATTWLISFQHVEEILPAAGDLLRLSSFLAPEGIPLSLFRESAKYLPPSLAGAADHPIILFDARSALRRYSLVSFNDEAMSIHRLVQVVMMDRMSDVEMRDWVQTVVQVVHTAFSVHNGQADFLRPLLSHALSAAAHAEKLGVGGGTTADLFNRVGLFLSGDGHLSDAKVSFGRALAFAERHLGPYHAEVATILNNLGSAERVLGNLEPARECHERALAIDRSLLPSKPENVGFDLYNLGLALFDLGREAEARELFGQALDALVENLGEEHPDTIFIRRSIEDLEEDSDG